MNSTGRSEFFSWCRLRDSGKSGLHCVDGSSCSKIPCNSGELKSTQQPRTSDDSDAFRAILESRRGDKGEKKCFLEVVIFPVSGMLGK